MNKYIPRSLDLVEITKEKSIFLLGPRQTGKSTLVRETLPEARVYNLLHGPTFLPLSQRPGYLVEQVHDPRQIVVIDEIQKLPSLLDDVHLLIEERNIRFVLTGSSARKLRRGGVNLLGGRARSHHLHPLSWVELGARFDLRRALSRGLLPSIYTSNAPYQDLSAYVGDYLRQEIAAEGLTRNVPAFSRVLEQAARCHGGFANYTAISQHAHVPANTVREYFQILRDTLLCHEVPALKTKKREALSRPKFFLFDIGVANYLLDRRGLRPRSPEFGFAFEALIFHELRTYIDYKHPGGRLRHWRSRSGFGVDFVFGQTTAIEVKAKEHVADRELRGLRALAEEEMLDRHIVVSMEATPRRIDNHIEVLPWQTFLQELWSGGLGLSHGDI